MHLKLNYGPLLALAGIAMLSLSAPAQAQSAYATDTSSLYTINLTTGAATLIGPYGGGASLIEGLAISPTGSLFGTDSFGSLFSLNPLTGAATLIGSTGRGDIEGLDFNGSTLIGTNFSNPTVFFSINPATAATSNIVTTSTGVIRGIDVTGPNTVLAVSDTPTFQTLQSINLTTGAATPIGSLTGAGASGTTISGLDVGSNGTLYGVNTSGDVFSINSATGSTTLVGSNPGRVFLDFKAVPAATAVVPESSGLANMSGALLALALGGLVVAVKKKKAKVSM